ncbi:hypothetical protein AWB65_06213 [Caballeronia humi]|uniref:Uncharacterized protein n=1 Tax=Caballeronia humi TaxID=326474 RepID=A0A158J9T2_9BURK|nr:hypothetical protein AWB65_06213 [Caballeronia humi]
MLSPHELATLMLVRSNGDRIQVDRADLHELLRRELTVEDAASGLQRTRLTPHWASILRAMLRLPQRLSRRVLPVHGDPYAVSGEHWIVG